MKSTAAKRDQEQEVTGEVSRHPEVWKRSLGAFGAPAVCVLLSVSRRVTLAQRVMIR